MEKQFRESIKAAISNPNLTGALGRFSEAYRISREKAYQGIDFEAVRSQIAELKAYAASHLQELGDLFEEKATANGAKVFRTSDPQAVREYILNLARENNVTSVVKSKSMASEEIHLNPALEAAGIEVNETDLGEWIIQLAGQTPSHMVMPAIHMTKEEVADVFSDKVEEGQAPDIAKLVKFARGKLRPKFLNAGMGITGANIAVAETGTLVIITNEGNARLVTTLPRIHVAIVGIEKLLANFADVVPILTALPRSATAQLLTSYVSIISGPVPNTDGSPKELHIILMDNKRTEMSDDPKFKQALQCIRCASCLNVCPVFRLVGGHVFGKVYTGGIGTILTAWFDALKESDEIQSLCIQCGACTQVCPGKIEIPGPDSRTAAQTGSRERPAVGAEGHLLGGQQSPTVSLYAARRLGGAKTAEEGRLHPPSALLPVGRHGIPQPAGDCRRALPRLVHQDRTAPNVASEKAAFYAGCLIDFAYPEMGESLVKMLNKAGIEVVFPEGQTCCGAPARFSGAYEVAARNASDNIDALLADDVQYVVSACPTCTVALKKDFISTFVSLGQTEKIPRARELAEKVVDIASLVAKLVEDGRLKFKPGQDRGLVTYHDSCHLKRTLNVYREPRELMAKAGYQLSEMAEADICCGMGGSYSLKLPEISAPILDRKLCHIENTKAPLVAMDCPGCVMQIRGGLDKRGSDLAVTHTVQLLAEALE